MARARGYMYIGNAERLVKVPCPITPFSTPASGRLDQSTAYNGDNVVTGSDMKAKKFRLSWRGDREDVQPAIDLYEGRWGNGPFWFLNPMALGGNVLPKHWATGRMAIQRRGTHAVLPPADKDIFPGSGTRQFNPHRAALALTNRVNLPDYGMRSIFVSDAAVATRVPNLSFPVGGNPFFVCPFPAGWSARLSGWGSLEQGATPLRYALTDHLVNTLPAALPTVASGTSFTPTTSGATATIASSANQRLFWLWYGAATNATRPVLNVSALELLMSSTSTPPAAPGSSVPFNPGLGQMPVALTSELTIDNYNTNRGQDISVAFEVGEVYQPW